MHAHNYLELFTHRTNDRLPKGILDYNIIDKQNAGKIDSPSQPTELFQNSQGSSILKFQREGGAFHPSEATSSHLPFGFKSLESGNAHL